MGRGNVWLSRCCLAANPFKPSKLLVREWWELRWNSSGATILGANNIFLCVLTQMLDSLNSAGIAVQSEMNKMAKGHLIRQLASWICIESNPYPNPIPEGVTNYLRLSLACLDFVLLLLLCLWVKGSLDQISLSSPSTLPLLHSPAPSLQEDLSQQAYMLLDQSVSRSLG